MADMETKLLQFLFNAIITLLVLPCHTKYELRNFRSPSCFGCVWEGPFLARQFSMPTQQGFWFEDRDQLLQLWLLQPGKGT